MEGGHSGEDGGFSHLVAHARWTVTDNAVDSPGSVGEAIQGTSRVALGRVIIRKDREQGVLFKDGAITSGTYSHSFMQLLPGFSATQSTINTNIHINANVV